MLFNVEIPINRHNKKHNFIHLSKVKLILQLLLYMHNIPNRLNLQVVSKTIKAFNNLSLKFRDEFNPDLSLLNNLAVDNLNKFKRYKNLWE